MRLLLDENCADAVLLRLLLSAGHDVESVIETLGGGVGDEIVADYAINKSRVLLTKDIADFTSLYAHRSEHAGLLLIREGRDRGRMQPASVVRAIANIEAIYPALTGMVLSMNEFIW